jgi:alpha-glucuronidase
MLLITSSPTPAPIVELATANLPSNLRQLTPGPRWGGLLRLVIILRVLGCALGCVQAASPYPYRLVWMWEEMDGKLLHVPGQPSFFSSQDMLHPASVPRYVRLAEYLRSTGINGLVVTVSFNDHSFMDKLPQLRATSEFLNGYGIRTYLHVPYGYRKGRGSSAQSPPNCVYDPEFAKYWTGLADKLYGAVPLLKGYVIKGTGYEGVPGPLSCRCKTCETRTGPERMLEALKILSRSVKEHDGAIFYRTWMTGALQDREYRLFAGLSGKLPENVFVVSKIGYGDFGIREIPHPLFGHLQPASQHIAEFQIFGEYRGLHSNPCEMVTNWGEWMREHKDMVGGFIADIEAGRDRFDHPLNLVNWYAFGRYASDPDVSPAEIIQAWSEQTYGKKAASAVAGLVKRTNVATSKLMYFKGVWIQQHSLLPSLGYLDSHLRGPWVDMKRDAKRIGWGKPLDLFPPAKAAKYAADPALELFIRRQEITPALMGLLSKQQDEAVGEFEAMLAEWRKARDSMEPDKYQPVERMLEASLDDARVWRLDVQAFINYVLGKEHQPQIAEMQELASKKKGTILVQHAINGVVRSYQR